MIGAAFLGASVANLAEGAQEIMDERQDREDSGDRNNVPEGLARIHGVIAHLVDYGAGDGRGEVRPHLIPFRTNRTLQEKNDQSCKNRDGHPIIHSFHTHPSQREDRRPSPGLLKRATLAARHLQPLVAIRSVVATQFYMGRKAA